MIIFLLFELGVIASFWSFSIYGATLKRSFTGLGEIPENKDFFQSVQDGDIFGVEKKDKYTEDIKTGLQQCVFLAFCAIVILTIVSLIKLDHFMLFRQKGYIGQYVWVAPMLVLFNIFTITRLFFWIKSQKKTKNK